MPVVSKEEIANAREMDLLSYLRSYEPDELVRFSGETYCTRTHDSLKISNGKVVLVFAEYRWSVGAGLSG